MINLLPDTDKARIRAARQNTILLRYVVLFSLILVSTVAIFGGGYYLAMQDENRARQTLAAEVTKTGKYAKTKAEAEAFAKDLATAKSVFSDGVSYSQLLLDLAEVVPSGTVIDSLNLTASTFGTPISITGKAKSLAKVEELKQSLENSDLFENVSTVSVTVAGDDNKGEYGYTVALNGTLSKPKDRT